MNAHHDLLGPDPVRLPSIEGAARLREAGEDARSIVAQYPKDSLSWAELASEALAAGDAVSAYAFARTGYHRGLDLLRGNGWRGHGPVPWSHESNRGVIRATVALARAARAIGETEEFERCRQLVADFDPGLKWEDGAGVEVTDTEV